MVGLAALTMASACSTQAPFDPADGSGGDCGNTPGLACTWAGVRNMRGFNGDGKALADSWLYFVEDLTFDPEGRAWVLDWNNHRVRRVEDDGTLRTMIGTYREGDGPPGEVDRLPLGAPEGSAPEDVALNHPTDLRFAPDGTLVLAAWHNHKLRVVDPTSKRLKVLAGDGGGYAGDNKPAYASVFNHPKAVVVDEAGRIYLTDQRNERIRMIDTDASRTSRTIAGACVVETIGGLACEKATAPTMCPGNTKSTWCADVAKSCGDGCTPASTGDGGPAIEARFAWDSGVTPNPSGALALRGRDLFIADTLANRIRKMDLDTGMIDCVAGRDCGIVAALDHPVDLEFGPDGRLYVADRHSNSIDAIDLQKGTFSRVAGNGQPCKSGSTNCMEEGTGHQALDIQLNDPYGIAFDRKGNLYVADSHNSRIVRIVGGAF